MRIERRIAEEKAAKESHEHHENGEEEEKEEKEEDESAGREKPRQNPALEQGNHMPAKYPEFPPELFGKPVEDLDEYYQNKYVSENQMPVWT